MSIPIHSKIRRNLKDFVNKLLINITSNKSDGEKIDPNEIKRILLVRINYRIGNVIFLTPLIKAISQKLPNAKIDIIVGAPFTIPILKNIPNVENVYDTPRKLLRNPIELFKKVREINKNNYDLIISPVGNSASSNIAISLLKAKYKLGFENQGTWSPINKTVPHSSKYKHEALKLLPLMEIFNGDEVDYELYLDVSLSEDEKNTGKQILFDLLQKHNIGKTPSHIIGIFRDARFDKKIANIWWQEFIVEMKKNDENILIIDILAPGQEIFTNELPSICISNLRELSKFLSSLDVFVCGDTGPMHLASASLVPVIALFNATSPDMYGPLGKHDNVIQINDKNISLVASEAYSYLLSLKI